MGYVFSLHLSPQTSTGAVLWACLRFSVVLSLFCIGVLIGTGLVAVVMLCWPVLVQLMIGAGVIALYAVVTMPRSKAVVRD